MRSKNSLVSRSHNKIKLIGDSIHKTSKTNHQKLVKELKWFQETNNEIINAKEINEGYSMNFLAGDNLGETFWKMSFSNQKLILDQLFRKLKGSIDFKKNSMFKKLLIDKFNERIKEIPKNTVKEIEDEIALYKDNVTNILSKINDEKYFNIMHGDFFLGNMISSENNIHLIDPRGWDEEYGVHGNVYYDLIKLAHSIHGKYDSVIFNYSIDEKNYALVKNYFFTLVQDNFNLSIQEILIGEIGLFISMLPIHAESLERQGIMINIIKGISKELKWKK